MSIAFSPVTPVTDEDRPCDACEYRAARLFRALRYKSYKEDSVLGYVDVSVKAIVWRTAITQLVEPRTFPMLCLNTYLERFAQWIGDSPRRDRLHCFFVLERFQHVPSLHADAKKDRSRSALLVKWSVAENGWRGWVVSGSVFRDLQKTAEGDLMVDLTMDPDFVLRMNST